MKKIKSITEAFSMQPSTLQTGMEYGCCKEIKLEKVFLINGDTEGYYIGYDNDNKEVFRYLEKCVNVHYI